jgi:hypothetical protein
MVSLATPLSRKPSSRKPSSRKPRRTGAKLARFVRRVVGYQKAHPSISFAEIARHFRISPYYAGMIFRRAGCKTPFPPRTKKPPQTGMYSGITADKLVQTFQQMGSSKRVAERWGLTRAYVNQVLLAAGCRTKRQPRPYDLQKAIARYKSGDPIDEIATENKIGHKRLRRDLVDAGVIIRPKTAWLKGWHAERSDAVKKIKAGELAPKPVSPGRPRLAPQGTRIFKIGQAAEQFIEPAKMALKIIAGLPSHERGSLETLRAKLLPLGFRKDEIPLAQFARTPKQLARRVVAARESMTEASVTRHHQAYLQLTPAA